MAELSTLARPYAKAAFNAALDSKQLDAWSTQLSTLAAISQHETVERLIANPELSAADKAKTLQQLAGDALNEGGSTWSAFWQKIVVLHCWPRSANSSKC